MRTAWILVAALVPGCTLLADADEPVESVEPAGPSFTLRVENNLPYALDVSARVGAADAALSVDAEATAERSVLLLSNGTAQVRVSYAWTQDGRAASGVEAVEVDPRACPRAVVTLEVFQADDGRTYSRAHTTC